MFTFLTKRKVFLAIMGSVHLGLLGCWVILAEYHRINAPFSPNPQTGQTYSLTYHGDYAYVTVYEYIVIWTIPLGCLLGLVFTSLIDDHYFKKKEDIDWKNPKTDD